MNKYQYGYIDDHDMLLKFIKIVSTFYTKQLFEGVAVAGNKAHPKSNYKCNYI